MLANMFFRIFSFLSSFLGSLIIIFVLYFFLDEVLAFALVVGLAIITLILLLTRTRIGSIRKMSSFARRQGVSRKQRLAFKKAAQNKFFSGHITRAFLIGYIFFNYNAVLLIPLTIYAALVILAMMKLRHASLLKIILSTILGTLTGVISVIISINLL